MASTEDTVPPVSGTMADPGNSTPQGPAAPPLPAGSSADSLSHVVGSEMPVPQPAASDLTDSQVPVHQQPSVPGLAGTQGAVHQMPVPQGPLQGSGIPPVTGLSESGPVVPQSGPVDPPSESPSAQPVPAGLDQPTVPTEPPFNMSEPENMNFGAVPLPQSQVFKVIETVEREESPMFGNDSPQTSGNNLANSQGYLANSQDNVDAIQSLEKLENLALLAQRTKSLDTDEDQSQGGSESSVDRELETFALLAGSKAMEGINEDSMSSASGAPISFDNMTPSAPTSAAETDFSHKLQQIREEEILPGKDAGTTGVDEDSVPSTADRNMTGQSSYASPTTDSQAESKSTYQDRCNIVNVNIYKTSTSPRRA